MTVEVPRDLIKLAVRRLRTMAWVG
jgi:hypothetical protein